MWSIVGLEHLGSLCDSPQPPGHGLCYPRLMSYESLALEVKNQIAWLTMNRPQAMNAMNPKLVDELRDFFSGLPQRHDIRVVVLRGAGRAFCAGLDLREPVAPPGQGSENAAGGPTSGLRVQRHISEIPMMMRRAPQPIIACVHGPACGGGFALALASDVRIAGESMRMNAAFIKIGLSACDVGVSYFLPRLVGASLASELMLTGRFIEAERALRTNLVSEVVPDAAMEEAVRPYLDDMMATSALGLRMTKEGMNMGIDAPGLEQAIAMEDRNQVLTIQSENFQEGMAAVLEKRAPQFDR